MTFTTPCLFMTRSLILIALAGSILSHIQLILCSSHDKVLLTEVQVLTVIHDKLTTGRRSPPVPQLVCVGGDACDYFQPQSMQCKNTGNDGFTVQWKCEADMDDRFRLGKVVVACEGYTNRKDKYVLRGSCGVEYTLHLTEKGQQWRSRHDRQDPYQRQHKYRPQEPHYKPDFLSGDFGWTFGFILIPLLWYFVTRWWNTPTDPRVHDGRRPPRPPSTFGRGSSSGDDDSPPPPYSPSNPYSRKSRPSSTFPTSSTLNNRGFWTGAGLGAAAGYAAARAASSSSSTTQARPTGNNGNSWFSFLRPSANDNQSQRPSYSGSSVFGNDNDDDSPSTFTSFAFGSTENR